MEYDLGFKAFKLPAVSVQILSENAVKHGLLKKEEGGTLKIRSYLESGHAVVEVVDDGVGFNEKPGEDDRKHLGLSILRERLSVMVNGTLEIESAEGKGTCARIRIPVKERFEE